MRRAARAALAAVAAATGLLGGCSSGDGAAGGGGAPPPEPDQLEAYRPRYHVTPPSGWMNDPNGLVYADGQWHLFYQYDPARRLPLEQHWGHAVSGDLARWDDRGVAIAPDERLGLAFSGSAVVDAANTSGLCDAGVACLVAIYTHSGGDDGTQKQSLAVSQDGGDTWTPYDGNPVLRGAAGTRAFRDPKVFWHEPSGRWVMVLAAGDRAQLFGSPNLIEWTFLSDFGAEYALGGVWECPDLFELAVDGGGGAGAGAGAGGSGGGETRWVLKTDFNPGPIIGFSGARYFVGRFDGARFVADAAGGGPHVQDGGADFYAAQSWSSAPNGRRVWTAWLSNWKYAMVTPTSPWRGAMTVPRDVRLVADADVGAGGGLVLAQQPVRELEARRGARLLELGGVSASKAAERLAALHGDALDVTLAIEPRGARTVTLVVRAGAVERTAINLDLAAGTLALDRSQSGYAGFDRAFPAVHTAPLRGAADGSLIELRVLVDRSSVEVFADDGRAVLTDLVFPDPTSRGVSLAWSGPEPRVTHLTVDALE